MIRKIITTINAGEGETDAPLDDAEAERRKASWSLLQESCVPQFTL